MTLIELGCIVCAMVAVGSLGVWVWMLTGRLKRAEDTMAHLPAFKRAEEWAKTEVDLMLLIGRTDDDRVLFNSHLAGLFQRVKLLELAGDPVPAILRRSKN